MVPCCVRVGWVLTVMVVVVLMGADDESWQLSGTTLLVSPTSVSVPTNMQRFVYQLHRGPFFWERV